MAKMRGVDLPIQNIVMSDRVNALPLRPTMNVIINSVVAGSPEGKHWTMMIVRGKYCLHFDSYAGNPTTSVYLFCRKHDLTLCHNKFIIQSMRSTNCGLFCVALLIYELSWKRQRVQPACWSNALYEMANDFINLFDADVNKNDALLIKYLK